MREVGTRGGGAVLATMATRGTGWGTVAGIVCGALAGIALVIGDQMAGGHPLGAASLAASCAFAGVYGAAFGLLPGLLLGLLEGSLLGLWTAAHPRPRALRPVYRRQGTVIVGLLTGTIVAVALGAAFLTWGHRPSLPVSDAGTREAALNVFSVLFVAAEAGVAAGWSTCRLLGWYANRAA